MTSPNLLRHDTVPSWISGTTTNSSYGMANNLGGIAERRLSTERRSGNIECVGAVNSCGRVVLSLDAMVSISNMLESALIRGAWAWRGMHLMMWLSCNKAGGAGMEQSNDRCSQMVR